MYGNYASGRMRNAYPAYQAGAVTASLPMGLPTLSTGTYELILVSDLGVSGTPVSTWTDQSSNAYIATGVGAARPTINGTDGTKQTILWANTSTMTIPSFAISTSFTIFMRADTDEASGAGLFLEHGPVVDTDPGFLFNLNKPGGDSNFGGITRVATGLHLRTVNLAEVVNTRSLWVLSYQASDQTWVMKQNGINLTQTGSVGSGPSTETTITDTLNIAHPGRVAMTAWISTIVICEGALSGAEITSVSSAINTYFA